MRPVPLTRASILHPVMSFLERAGAPVERLLAEAGLPASVLTDPEVLIPTSSTARLFALAARTGGLEDVGVRAGQEAPIERLGVYGRLIRRSATLGDALEETVTVHPIFSSNGSMWLVARGDGVDFCQALTNKFDPCDEGWQQVNHYILMLMLGIVRLATGDGWRPGAIRLQTAPSAALARAETLAGVHLTFGRSATVITLPRALMDAPLRARGSDLEVPDDGVDAWRTSAPADDFVQSIVQVVDTLSWNGYPDIRITASALGTSVRTLQRHLSEAGVTHERLVGRARFTAAAALLRETDAKILDIALDLGYSDHAHFTRAFRRWAGCSPQHYRRSRSASRPVPASAA
jgi:AraC-like DNA-binding protein